MHIPKTFKETDPKKLYGLVRENPLGTLVTRGQNMLDADHLPFYLEGEDSEQVVLKSHIAKVNSLWKNTRDGDEVLLIFHGPNTYISPNFYPSKQATGKAVPTWNYSVVHVRGRIYFKQEPSWILGLLEQISDAHEQHQERPWSVADAPEGYIEKMAKAVIGLEVIVEDVVGNFKLSQNKSADDYQGVLSGLSASDAASDAAVLAQMKEQ